MDHTARLDDIRERLQSINAELDDLGLDALREAVDAGASKRPEIEKVIATTRRAIDKAIRTLDR